MLKVSKDSFLSKHFYSIVNITLGVLFIGVGVFYLIYDSKPNNEPMTSMDIPKALYSLDNFEDSTIITEDSVSLVFDDEATDEKSDRKSSDSKQPKVEKLEKELVSQNNWTQKSGSNIFKRLKVNDVKNISRTLKAKSISARTIIEEVNRIVTKENNSTVNGATLVNALGEKLTSKTKTKILEQVKSVTISDNVILVKLKDVSSVKLTFKTDKGRQTIKVHDNAVIRLDNASKKVTAQPVGFSYHHLGMYWKVKNVDIQQTNQKGTLDIQLNGKLKDISLPTITLGNLHRKMY